MNELLVLAAHNTIIGLALAIVVYCVTRSWKNPPVAHALWLLVLLKLVAPPILHIDLLANPRQIASQGSNSATDGTAQNASPLVNDFTVFADSPIDPNSAASPNRHAAAQPIEGNIPQFWNLAAPVVFWTWLAGTVCFALIAAGRIVRFERRLKDTFPAPERIQQLTSQIAREIGLRRAPAVRTSDVIDIPLLWSAVRRPTIIVPRRLLHDINDRQLEMILAHELAHLRRRDHWVRAIELVVATIYWWNPLVRLIRQQLHAAEDLCCDAWVNRTYPDNRRQYADLLFTIAQTLDASQTGLQLLPASQFLFSMSLKARIQMILENRLPTRLTKRSILVVGLFAFLAMFSFAPKAQLAAAPENHDAATTSCDTAFLAKLFKYKVPFEIGLSETAEGGRIEIREVWGTRPQIEVGGQYLVRGKYVLPAGVRAKLYFYATAGGPWGKTASLDLQSTSLDKPDGEFALVHGMAGEGNFHLVLSDEQKYSRMFANVYFGTGDNVLRKFSENAQKSGGNAQYIGENSDPRSVLMQILGAADADSHSK